jgi:dTDP-4-amino-4,6-dideoxygalactose transaminase
VKVEFYKHSLGEQDIANVAEVLRSVFLTTGPVTARFEEDFAGYTGLRHVVALNSCTAALQLALEGLGIGPGDEVIVPAMTFIATATAVLHTGATPVLVDVEENTGLIDVTETEKAITERTRAIVPVHLYGAVADMRALRQLADAHDLKMVEDGAHCIEGERDGVRPGQLGDAVCYSFYATKNLTCGEGGALGTNDSELAKKVGILKLHGMSKDAAGRYGGRYQHWDMLLPGWKCNLSDIQAALLVGQLPRLDRQWERRQAISQRYDTGLGSVDAVRLPTVPGKSAYHLYTIWVPPDERDELLRKLPEEGVGVAVNYRAMHTLTYFREAFHCQPGDFPVAFSIGESTITLPLYPKLTDAEVDYVIDTVRTALG